MMIDREKVIKGLESLRDICNAKSNMAIGNGNVAWAGYANAADDALALLKEQEPVEPIPPTDESDLWKCGNCNHQLFRCTQQRYCEMCGRQVKWDEL